MEGAHESEREETDAEARPEAEASLPTESPALAAVAGAEAPLTAGEEGLLPAPAGGTSTFEVDVDLELHTSEAPTNLSHEPERNGRRGDAGEALESPSDLDEARDTGDTGKTGDTVFVGSVAQRAFARGAEASLIAEVAGDEDERARSGVAFGRLLTRVVPVLLLLAVIGFSARELLMIEAGARARGASSSGDDPGADATSAGDLLASAGHGGPLVEADLPPLPERGVPVKAILDHEVERVRPGEPVTFTRLGSDVIEARRVTVINLWATHCKPCKSELPDLKAMFQRAGWGERVRFASILSQDPISPEAAHRDYAAMMPSTEHFLAEVSSTDAMITDALLKKGLIDEGGLPLTVVLDCRRNVRFAHQGRLGPRNFEELQGMLDALVGELDGDYCAVRRRKKVANDPAPPVEEPPAFLTRPSVDPFQDAPGSNEASKKKVECGDGRCTQGAEDCHGCPLDCACAQNSECKKIAARAYACVLAASALKD